MKKNDDKSDNDSSPPGYDSGLDDDIRNEIKANLRDTTLPGTIATKRQ